LDDSPDLRIPSFVGELRHMNTMSYRQTDRSFALAAGQLGFVSGLIWVYVRVWALEASVEWAREPE
jgi:hypothetical protein